MSDPRPHVDVWHMRIAMELSTMADCTRRQVGALVTRGKFLVGHGINGAPQGEPGCLSAGACPRGRHYAIDNPVEPWRPVCACGEPSWPCPHSVSLGSGYDTGPGACHAIHAEMNAIFDALRNSPGGIDGLSMTVTEEPCDACSRHIRRVGIVRVVTPRTLVEAGLWAL